MAYIFHNRTFQTLEEASLHFRVPVNWLEAKLERDAEKMKDEEDKAPFKGLCYKHWGFSYDEPEDTIEFDDDDEYIDLDEAIEIQNRTAKYRFNLMKTEPEVVSQEKIEYEPLSPEELEFIEKECDRILAECEEFRAEQKTPKAGKWMKHNI